MRRAFVSALGPLVDDERVVFLSGDLGFMAFEPIRDRMGPRFINVGVAEQNMVSVAAGMAARGFQPWVYSIAPFTTLRPYEQLRNDVCFHRLPVRVVGNGGGYAYGIMGATHHSLEDIGCMQLLPNMKVLVPSFTEDVGPLVLRAHGTPGPVYLRLGTDLFSPVRLPPAPWRAVGHGTRAVVVCAGPVIGGLLELLEQFPSDTFEIFTVTEFPIPELDARLLSALEATRKLIVVEEHLPPGGLAQALAHAVLGRVGGRLQFLPLSAKGYPSGRYGSQKWHWRECGLAGPQLKRELSEFLERENVSEFT